MIFNMNYLSLPAGGGKTTLQLTTIAETVSKAIKSNSLVYYLYAVPSVEFVEEAKDFLEKALPRFEVRTIYAEDNEELVSEQLEDVFKSTTIVQLPIVVICTFQGLLCCKNFPNVEQWELIIDDPQELVKHKDMKLSLERKQFLVDQYLQFDDFSDYCTLTLKDKLSETVTFEDEIYNLFEDVYKNSNYFGIYHNSFKETNRLVITSFLKPDLFQQFKSVTFLGARFEHSILYKFWKKLGIQWTRIGPVQPIQHNAKVHIIYGYTSAPHSKNFLEKVCSKTNKTMEEMFYKAVNEFSIDGKYIHTIPKLIMSNVPNRNEKDKSRLKKHPCFNDGDIFLQHNCHGTNKHLDRISLLYDGAFNFSPAFYDLMKFLGLDYSASDHLYQVFLRLKIRMIDYNGDIYLFLPCLPLFKEISDYFPNKVYYNLDLDKWIEDGRKTELDFKDECYENKRCDWFKVGFTKNTITPDRVRKEFKNAGYQLEEIEVKMPDYRIVKKSFWYRYPDSIADYCLEKNWKIVD